MSSVPGQNMHFRFSSVRNVFLVLMTSDKHLKTLAEHYRTVHKLEKKAKTWHFKQSHMKFITHDFKISGLG